MLYEVITFFISELKQSSEKNYQPKIYKIECGKTYNGFQKYIFTAKLYFYRVDLLILQGEYTY